jgi:hypothetical protein
MQVTQNKISKETRGELVSTTDTKRARLLGRRVSIKQILAGRLAHFEVIDTGVLLYAGRELYELKTV